MKYIILTISVTVGDYEVIARHSLATNCNSIDFAVTWYIAHYFYGLRFALDIMDWTNGEVIVSGQHYQEITREDYCKLIEWGI